MLLKKSSSRPTLNTLSSDDSEIDQIHPSGSEQQKKRLKHRNQTSIGQLKKFNLMSTDKNNKSSSQQQGVFKKTKFKRKKSMGKTTNSSHCVSWRFVFTFFGTFLILRLFCMSTIQKTQLKTSKRHLDSHIRENIQNAKGRIPSHYSKPVLVPSRSSHDLLSNPTGEYDRQITRATRNVIFAAIKTELKKQYLNYEMDEKMLSCKDIFKRAILLIQKNPGCGIRVFPKFGVSLETDVALQIDDFSLKTGTVLQIDDASLETDAVLQIDDVSLETATVLQTDDDSSETDSMLQIDDVNLDTTGTVLQSDNVSLERDTVLQVNDVSALEWIYSYKSFWCSLQHSIFWTFTKLLLLVFVVALTGFHFAFLKIWREKEGAAKKSAFYLLRKI